jgi:thiosulfate dehydrogenase [quinone] large subunit
VKPSRGAAGLLADSALLTGDLAIAPIAPAFVVGYQCLMPAGLAQQISRWRDGKAAALALGRWSLGIVFLFSGIGKLRHVSGFVAAIIGQFEQTWLPSVLVSLFSHVLPFVEVVLGLLLLLGVFRQPVLFATGVLLLHLIFGQVLLGQPQVVFFNCGYLFMTAALLFFSEYDRWTLLPERWIRANARAEI